MKMHNVVIALAAVAMFSVSAFGQAAAPTCESAPVVGVPSTTPGNTLPAAGGGGAYGPLSDCLDTYGGPGGFVIGGQWVQVVGTGNTMTASLCPNEKANTDAAVVVICNSCNGPMCAGAGEDECGVDGYSPETSWCSIAGQIYWVGAGDNFLPQDAINIDITDDGTPCQDPRSCEPTCGDDVREGKEECDGADNAACEVSCEADCTCTPSVCGNDIQHGDEECDGTDNAACEVSCEGDCTCTPPVCGNGIIGEGEECDGDDTGECLGSCEPDCTCTPVPVPMLPAWGLIGLAVLLAGGGATVFGRRRR